MNLKKKRKKSSRMRGSVTHGIGGMKKARGSGHRGGFGMAGTGKRADQRKSFITNMKDKYFGGKSLNAKPRNYEVINVSELEKMANPNYLDDLFNKIDPEIKKNIKKLHKSYPYAHFSKEPLYQNQKQIEQMLNPVQGLNAYFQEKTGDKIILSVGNVDNFPLEISDLKINNTFIQLNKKTILPSWDKNGTLDYYLIEFKLPTDFSWNSP